MGFYVAVSLFTNQSAIEHTQAALFVDVFKFSEQSENSYFWRGTAFLPDLRSLLGAVLGKNKANEVIASYAEKHKINMKKKLKADPGMVNHAEKILAGAIGSASAHVMVASVVKEEPLGVQEVMEILDETRQAIAYSRDLEKATAELKAANKQLKDLDNFKDEFIATVTHELRTPLTSVRALAGILHDNPDLDKKQQKRFSGIIIHEGERLTRLINQVLDFQKIESGKIEMQISLVSLNDIILEALTSTKQLIGDKHIHIELNLADNVPNIHGDRDRLIQVMLNLISNAVKFCDREKGVITISLIKKETFARIDVKDNGQGISRENLKVVFERFWQVKNTSKGRPAGSGLGLAIAKQIIERHNGEIWVKSKLREGSIFSFLLPLKKTK
jgi:signal transduction histidine kinase